MIPGLISSFIMSTALGLGGGHDDSCPCGFELVHAEPLAEIDLFGFRLSGSVFDGFLYVTALTRPGIPGQEQGAVDVYRIVDDCTVVKDSTIEPPIFQHGMDFGARLVPVDDGLFVGAPATDLDGLMDAGQIYWCSRGDDGAWNVQPLASDMVCPHRRIGSTIVANSNRMVACENNCDGPSRRVWVFDRVGDSWQFSGFINRPSQDEVPCTGVCWSSFGNSLAVGSDFIIVATSSSQNDGRPNAGRANVFRLSEKGEWVHSQQILPDVSEEDAGFGFGMLLADDHTLYVAASYSFHPGPGKVYKFERGPGADIWVQVDMHVIDVHTVTSTSDFGHSMALSPDGSLLAVSAPKDQMPGGAAVGVTYVIDLETREQRVLRYVDDDARLTVIDVAFLSDHHLAVGEPAAWANGREFAGRVIVYDLETFVHCRHDIDRDANVGGDDLLALLSDWNTSATRSDFNCDGSVGFYDLLQILSEWGDCHFVPPE